MTIGRYALVASLLLSAAAFTGIDPAAAARSVQPFDHRQSRGSLFEWSPLVQQLQEFLIEFELFAGPADGRLTPETRQAIRAYQEQSELTADGEPDQDLLRHMETVGRAETLKARLARARDEQIEKAREALSSNPATRDLIENGETTIAALPKDAIDACLRAPSVNCLLASAADAAAGIERTDYRDWALRDVIRAQATAGRAEQARDGIRRLSDLRLVLVALREAVAALAKAGHVAEARALSETIPEPWNRARALLAIAKTDAGLPAAHATLMALLPSLSDDAGAVEIAAELAADLADRGERDRAAQTIASVEALPAFKSERAALGAIATAYARIGMADETLDAINRLGDSGRDHIALAEAAAMLARKGKPDAAQKTANRLRTPQLYVLAMTKIATAALDRGEVEDARASLAKAEAAVPDIERPFASDTALARIAEVWAKLQDSQKAFEAIARIGSQALKARTLWQFAAREERASADSPYVRRAGIETERIESAFDRAAVYARAAVELAEAGRQDAAKSAFDLAVRETKAIRDGWWRARILSLLATALIAI